MKDGVVLLHALARRPQSMARLAASLNGLGFETLNLGYPSRTAGVAELALGIAPEIAGFAETVGRLHFVGHSLGGLVARVVIARDRPARLGALVTMGTPHGGSEIVDLLGRLRLFRAVYGPVVADLSHAAEPARAGLLGPLDYPLGAIAGTRALNIVAARLVVPRPNDGTVSVASALPREAADRAEIACDHFNLPLDPRVVALTGRFLTTGRFGAAA